MTGYQRLLGYGIMKHAKEKGATAKPAFAFQGELTSKCFCEAETKALQERICESNQLKRKANNCKAKTKALQERICESNQLKRKANNCEAKTRAWQERICESII